MTYILVVCRREPGRSALSNHHEKPGLRTIGFAYCGTGAVLLLRSVK
jgi:hypothetical protein